LILPNDVNIKDVSIRGKDNSVIKIIADLTRNANDEDATFDMINEFNETYRDQFVSVSNGTKEIEGVLKQLTINEKGNNISAVIEGSRDVQIVSHIERLLVFKKKQNAFHPSNVKRLLLKDYTGSASVTFVTKEIYQELIYEMEFDLIQSKINYVDLYSILSNDTNLDINFSNVVYASFNLNDEIFEESFGKPRGLMKSVTFADETSTSIIKDKDMEVFMPVGIYADVNLSRRNSMKLYIDKFHWMMTLENRDVLIHYNHLNLSFSNEGLFYLQPTTTVEVNLQSFGVFLPGDYQISWKGKNESYITRGHSNFDEKLIRFHGRKNHDINVELQVEGKSTTQIVRVNVKNKNKTQMEKLRLTYDVNSDEMGIDLKNSDIIQDVKPNEIVMEITLNPIQSMKFDYTLYYKK